LEADAQALMEQLERSVADATEAKTEGATQLESLNQKLKTAEDSGASLQQLLTTVQSELTKVPFEN